MRWWVGVSVAFVFAGSLLAAELRSVPLSPGVDARLNSDYDIYLVVEPHKGDAWTRLSRRVTGDAMRWKELAAANKLGEQLTTDARVKVPLSMARPELRVEAIRALFKDDGANERGWRHKVIYGAGSEGEPLWKIAEWFTGDGSNYSAIRAANKDLPLATSRGTVVVIPEKLLLPPFRSAIAHAKTPKTAEVISSKKSAVESETREVGESPEARSLKEEGMRSEEARNRRNEELSRRGSHASVNRVLATESSATRSEPIVAMRHDEIDVVAAAPRNDDLTYIKDGGREYAVYRLKKGEALYSSVVSRFTGRVYAEDVHEMVAKIVEVNKIADVARIYVDEPIRIPVEYLTTEYLPGDNQRRIEYETARRASAQAGRRVEAKNLSGVHIVIDAGHGGRDVGTVHDDLWESSYVYDVACRLKRLIEKKSGATVHLTTRSADHGYNVADSDVLEQRNDHVVLTNPKYILDDPVIGVNLRWYLANSIFRRAVAKNVAPEKVIFLSIHADSLHPSLRGAMAYIPGQRFTQGSFSKKGQIYLAREEVRESPQVHQTEEEALQAEGLSRKLAEAIIDSMADAELPVHPHSPVREHVIRDGKEWVPAIIRYNKIPTRLLLEICNLGNAADREAVQTRAYRQEIAKSIFDGIVNFYATPDKPVVEPKEQPTSLAAK